MRLWRFKKTISQILINPNSFPVHAWLVTNDLFATTRRTKPLTEERTEAITSALSMKQYFNFCHQSGEAEVLLASHV